MINMLSREYLHDKVQMCIDQWTEDTGFILLHLFICLLVSLLGLSKKKAI